MTKHLLATALRVRGAHRDEGRADVLDEEAAAVGGWASPRRHPGAVTRGRALRAGRGRVADTGTG